MTALADQIAVVTGASNGIGKAIVSGDNPLSRWVSVTFFAA